jgi:cohesin loading factor subunit SCC2
MVLLTLSRGLANDIFKASSSTKATSRNAVSIVESTYLSTAFDILGKISASVAAILACQREKPLSIARQIQQNRKANSEGLNVNSCYCGRHNFVDTLMVSCDTCRGFFHAECVGENRGTLETDQQWQCDNCKLKSVALEETKAFVSRRGTRTNVTETVPPVMETHVFRQLVLAYLSDTTDLSPAAKFAREFLLANWVNDLNVETGENAGIDPRVLAQQFLDLWDRPLVNPLTSKQAGIARLLNKDGCHRLMVTLAATKSDLVASFPRQMGLLIQFMGDETFVSIRKLAVKALSQVVDADSKLMLHPALKNAVSVRFADEAKSVREAVVGLVGAFVVSCPELANAFHSSFLERLHDEGVSVRKRTVKIFRDILMTNPNYTGRAAACALMLKRATDPKEDDAIRDLIHEVFKELWLESSEVSSPVKRMALLVDEDDHTKLQVTAVSGKSIVTPIASPDKPRRATKAESNVEIRCRLAAEQMVDVVHAAGSKDTLAALLRDLLSDFSDADKDRKGSDRKKRRQSSSSHCSLLVDALIERLLSLEEDRGSDVDVFGKKLVATISTIGAIASVAPQEVHRHVDTLLPYLKADNGLTASHECNIVSEVCDILHRDCRIMSKGEVMQLSRGSLGDDLVNVTYRLGSGALASAVRSLCELGNHPKLGTDNAFRQIAMKLTTTFYSYLRKDIHMMDDLSTASKKTQCNIQRALSVLGCLCKSHAVENDDTAWMERSLDEETLILPTEVTWDIMVEICYKIFLTYLAKSDVETKCSAMKALGGIFISRPRVLLAMQQAGTIDNIMAPGSEPELQLQALRCWREILLAEEQRVESGDAKAKMESNQSITVSKKISGDQDSDATLVGGVLACHAQRLHEMTKDKNERIRYACVDLLSHLLRQGLLNPFQTIPFLFGLQGDVEAPDIRSLALKLLINEGEKRPDMLRQRICAGVKNAFRFQQAVYPERETTAGMVRVDQGKTTYECIFGAVFKECIRNTKKQKHGLFTNLLGLFNTGEGDELAKKTKKRNTVELPLLSFTAELLAYLPYNTANDPLFIIYQIQSAAALYGGQHLDSMISFLKEQGFPIDVNDENTEEDDLEIAAKAKHPSRSKQALLLNKRSFDILRFEELCETASSFILLLRLKAYLRTLYNLSETRCLVYSPEGLERNFDKMASSITHMPRFDSKITGFFRNQFVNKDDPNEKDVDKDAVIMQYAEFRRLLRMEQTVGSRISEMDEEEDDEKIAKDD